LLLSYFEYNCTLILLDDPDAVERMLEWMYTGDYDHGGVDGDDNGGGSDDDTLWAPSFRFRKKGSSRSRKDAPVEESEDEKRGEDTDKEEEASSSITVD
jgi:hypothetical protein